MMPWKIVEFPMGSSGMLRPFRVYPNGFSECATQDDLLIWEHVQQLQAEVEALQNEIEQGKAAPAELAEPVAAAPGKQVPAPAATKRNR